MTTLSSRPQWVGTVPGSSVLAPVGAAAAFLVYSLAVPVAVGLSIIEARSAPTAASIVLLVISVYSGTRIAYEVARGASRWFVLVFHSFAYVFLGVVPLVQSGAATFLWAVDPASDVLLEAAALCLAGVLLFDLGSWVGGSLKSSRGRAARLAGREDRSARPESELGRYPRAGAAARVLVLLVVLAVLSLVLFYVRGALAVALASRSEMEAVLCPLGPFGDLAECGVVTAMVRVPAVILTIAALGLRSRVQSAVFWLAVIVGLMAMLVTSNPISTPRFWFGAAALGVIGVLTMGSARARIMTWVVLPALLILVFPSLDFGRSQGWTPSLSIQTEAIVQKQDFDAFQQVLNGISYVEAFGTRGGMQTSSAVLFFVPRGVWPDKAPPTGPLVASSLGVTDNTNVSAPIWEEAYIDFGPMGVAVVLFGLGWLVAYLEVATKASRAGPDELAVAFAPFFAAYGVFLLRGSLLPAIGPLAFALFLFSVVHHFGRQVGTRVDDPRALVTEQQTNAAHNLGEPDTVFEFTRRRRPLGDPTDGAGRPREDP
jgi:hypothetical protein